MIAHALSLVSCVVFHPHWWRGQWTSKVSGGKNRQMTSPFVDQCLAAWAKIPRISIALCIQ